MDNFFPDTLAGWIGIIATPLGALWALLTFHRNNRSKAAEILINIETEYSRHIPTLLQLENMTDYSNIYRRALNISLYRVPGPYSPDESKAIDGLEAALRHFFVCANVRRLSVDAGAIDRLCAWYLRVFVTDRDEAGNIRRPELRDYIQRYWPSVYFWAQLAPEPWPKRAIIYLLQIRERVHYWWTGSWAKPPQHVHAVTSASLRLPTIDSNTGAEQSHHLKRADGPVSNGDSSPPAQ